MSCYNNKGLPRDESQGIQEIKTFGMDFCSAVSANFCWPSSWISMSHALVMGHEPWVKAEMDINTTR